MDIPIFYWMIWGKPTIFGNTYISEAGLKNTGLEIHDLVEIYDLACLKSVTMARDPQPMTYSFWKPDLFLGLRIVKIKGWSILLVFLLNICVLYKLCIYIIKIIYSSQMYISTTYITLLCSLSSVAWTLEPAKRLDPHQIPADVSLGLKQLESVGFGLNQ